MNNLDKRIEELLAKQDWGYLYQMSDYATNSEQEKEYERLGKLDVKELAGDLKQLFYDMANEIIGEDEEHGYAVDNIDLAAELNYLRAKQRENIEQIAGVKKEDLWVDSTQSEE